MKKTKPKAGLRKAAKSRKAGRQSPSLESRKAAKGVRDTLDEIESELQGVDFPGMYG